MTTTLRTPPFLLAAALLFWGGQSGQWVVGALLAAVLEGARFVPWRWDIVEKDFRRTWDFCTFLFVAVAIYLFAANEGATAVAGLFGEPSPANQNRAVQVTAQAMMIALRWLPVILFLMAAAQAFSTLDKLPWTVFSPVMRRLVARGRMAPPAPGRGVNTSWPYFAICVLASSIAVRPGPWFFVGLVVLVGWALWFERSKRFSVAVWVAVFSLALGGGFLAQLGFVRATTWANIYSANWLMQFIHLGTDPKASRTELGRLGRIKLSGRIVLRVEPKANQPVPSLLREASYRFFKFPDWVGSAKGKDFGPVNSDTNLTTWEIAPRRPATSAVRLAQYLTGRGEDARRGLLAVPQGIVRLENLGAFQVSTSRLGVVSVDEGPGLVLYDAVFTGRSTIDAPPDREDMAVPTNEVAALERLVGELRLRGQATDQILKTVETFFLDKFQYSTWLPGSHGGDTNLTALGNFLLKDRAGHCEYFATAAALLLRKAGVPARYAVGYSVQERAGSRYVVRERHAHAWCLAWAEGTWRDFDVTPPSWAEAEAQRASWTERLTDAWSRMMFEFSKWRWGLANWRKYLLWILTPALVVLLGRLFLGKQWRRFRQDRKLKAAAALWPGIDSEFYQLERELVKRGLHRPPHETPGDWLKRVRDHPALGTIHEPLDTVLRLHYRHRFDPAGLDTGGRGELRTGVRACLERLRES